MKKIFSTIFNWWTKQSEFLLNLTDKLIDVSIEVYTTVCASLLPTPSKSHYTFNLRDLSKVFQGMLMMESKKVDVRKCYMGLVYFLLLFVLISNFLLCFFSDCRTASSSMVS